MKLKFKEIKTFRDDQLKKQNKICPICLNVIEPDKATLDHNHKTGHIRMVFHRGCNRFEGKCNRFAPGTTKKDKIATLLRMV